MSQPDTVTLLIALAATISAMAAVGLAYIAVRQVRVVQTQSRETHDWNRRKTTLEMANAIILGEDYRDLRARLMKLGIDILDTTTTTDQVFEALGEEDAQEAEVLLKRLFNLFECFCTALKHKIVDEVIAKDLLVLFFVFWYEKCHPFLVEQNRDEGQQGMFGEYLVYAKSWRDEYQKEFPQQGETYVYRSKSDAKPILGK